MSAYYNEIDPYAAQWLRNLIKEGLIADGEVDTRSIVDVRASDLAGYTQCHFFAGLGGWSGALRLACIPDDRAVWTGSCPCQPFSLAGKRGGFDDERHLWPVWRELVRERRPATIFGEQVASAAQWLRLVRSDLEAMDYAVGCLPFEAASAGADHLRDRYWFMANAHSETGRRPTRDAERRAGLEAFPERTEELGRRGSSIDVEISELSRCEGWDTERDWSGPALPSSKDGNVADGEVVTDPRQRLREERQRNYPSDTEWGDRSCELSWVIGADGKTRRVKSGVRLLAHGVPCRVAKLRALGNAIDLRPAAAFIKAAMS